MNSKLKEIIFKKLYSDLSHVEIILHDTGSIWFIDRGKKYWYLELEKSGHLWWRYQFFTYFFILFSLERVEYEQIIMEWVEDVLNRKVVSPVLVRHKNGLEVEDVLNRKVVSPGVWDGLLGSQVEDVLNRKVVSPHLADEEEKEMVEDVLNRKATTSNHLFSSLPILVKEVLTNNSI